MVEPLVQEEGEWGKEENRAFPWRLWYITVDLE